MNNPNEKNNQSDTGELSSEQLLQIFNEVEDVVICMTPEYVIRNINNRGLCLLNKRKEEVIGQKCYDEICGYQTPPDYCPIFKSRKSLQAESVETYYSNFDKYFSVRASPLFDEFGSPVYYVDILRDIDHLKRSEIKINEKNEEIATQNEEIRNQNEELQGYREEIEAQNEELQSNLDQLSKANDQLKTQNQYLEALTQIRQILLHETREKSLLEKTCERIYNILDYSLIVAAYKVYNAGKDLKVVVSYGVETEWVNHLRFSWGDGTGKEDLAGQAVKTGACQSGSVTDQMTDGDNRSKMSMACFFPLKEGDDIYGVIGFYTTAGVEFTSPETTFLQNLVNDVCHGIEALRNSGRRRKAEKALQSNKNKLESIFESAPILMMLVDDNARIVKINQPGLGFADTSQHNALNGKVGDVFQCIHAVNITGGCGNGPDCNSCTIRNIVRKTFETKENQYKVEASFTRKEDGKYQDYYFLVSTTMFSATPPQVLISIDDITERKTTEIQLREQKTKLKQAQEIAKVGNWELDIINDKLYWSDEIYKMFELDPGEFEATYEAFLDRIHPDDRDKVDKAYQDSLRHMKPYNIDHRLLLKNNKVKFVREKCYTDFDANNKPIRSVGIVMDITDIKKAEQQMQQALEKEKEVNQLRLQFISTVTHEFRTPLASIYSNTQLLHRYDHKWDLQQKERSFSRIYSSINTMVSLLDDVSILGKEQSGRLTFEPEPVNLYDLVAATVQEANEAYPGKPDIRVYYSIPDITIHVDKTLVRLALINVCTNAIKYSSSEDPSPHCTINYENAQNRICMVIEDYGMGMNDYALNNIFHPFFRGPNAEKIKGTGLGMSIVKQSLELHKGEIYINSKEGQGTKVLILLPFTRYK